MKKLIPFALFAVCLYSCTKSTSSQDPGKTDSTVDVPEVAVPVDVYVACTIGRVDTSQAGYWKNGTLFPVSEKHFAWYAVSVFPIGNDIYISGAKFDTLGYWKNGTFTSLLSASGGNGFIAMTVNGADRYEICAANVNGKTTGGLYKNDQLQQPGGFSGVVTDGSDVYVYGAVAAQDGRAVATIWKNGIPQTLGQSSNATFVNDLAVLNGNTYACGYEMDAAKHAIGHYWKNGVDSVLSDASGIMMPNNIAVSAAGNVHMIGYKRSGTFQSPGTDVTYFLWKNSKSVDFTPPAGTINVFDLAVNGPDVYTLLTLPDPDQENVKNVIWKNGTIIPVSGDARTVNANSITLVKK